MLTLPGRVVRDDRRRALLDEQLAQSIGVVGAVCGAQTGWRKLGDEDETGADVAELSRRHPEALGRLTMAEARLDRSENTNPKALSRGPARLLMVGDPRQITYLTHHERRHQQEAANGARPISGRI